MRYQLACVVMALILSSCSNPQDSIRGIAFLDEADSEYPNLSIIRVRLGAEMRQLETVLMRLNKECIQKDEGC